MGHEKVHDEIIEAISKQYSGIFEHSEQAIYVYLDDEHIIMNKNFVKLLGYSSQEEMEKEGSFLDALVSEKSQKTLVSAYRNSMEKMVGSTIKVTWKKKSGTVLTSVILVPIEYDGHLLALHFIDKN